MALISVLQLADVTAFADLSFPDFSDASSLQLNGEAAAVNDGVKTVLRLTDNVGFDGGSAFTKSQVALGFGGSFSTSFSFRFTGAQNGGADGMVFVVQKNASTALGGAGGGIGYDGMPNSVGVEFDTFDNGEINGNHVGIDVNGSVIPGGPSASLDGLGQLDEGGVWYSWIDYDGTSDLLEVRVNTSSSRPAVATLTTLLDIPGVLGANDGFVGFTAATGGAQNNHDVLDWNFKGGNAPGVPEGGSTALFLATALAGLAAFRRRT